MLSLHLRDEFLNLSTSEVMEMWAFYYWFFACKKFNKEYETKRSSNYYDFNSFFYVFTFKY